MLLKRHFQTKTLAQVLNPKQTYREININLETQWNMEWRQLSIALRGAVADSRNSSLTCPARRNFPLCPLRRTVASMEHTLPCCTHAPASRSLCLGGNHDADHAPLAHDVMCANGSSCLSLASFRPFPSGSSTPRRECPCNRRVPVQWTRPAIQCCRGSREVRRGRSTPRRA